MINAYPIEPKKVDSRNTYSSINSCIGPTRNMTDISNMPTSTYEASTNEVQAGQTELDPMAVYVSFEQSCRDGDQSTASYLLETYGPESISSQKPTYKKDGAFEMVCRNSWRDMADLLIDGFIVTLDKHGFLHFRDAYISLCLCGWTDPLKRLLEGIQSLSRRQNMVNIALQLWATNTEFETCQMLVDSFGSDINKEILEEILDYVCIHDHFDPIVNSNRHTFVNSIIDRFRDIITPTMYERALNSACEGGCTNMLDRFASDLKDKVQPEVYLQVLETNLKGYGWLDDHRPFEAYVQRFSSGLTDATCQDIFDRILTACTQKYHRASSMLTASCLETFGHRITFVPDYLFLKRMACSRRKPSATGLTCPALKPILRFYGDGIDADMINKLAVNKWSKPDIMSTLIECCKDKIDGSAIIDKALTNIGWVIAEAKSYYADDWLSSFGMDKAIKWCKYILIQFFVDISCQHTIRLLKLSPDALYSLLGADDVRILIGTHMHDGSLDKAIAALDPYHEHTYYILTDYRDRRIRAPISGTSS